VTHSELSDTQSTYIGCSHTRLTRQTQTEAWSLFSSHSSFLIMAISKLVRRYSFTLW